MRLITITSILFATAHVAFSVPVYSLAPRAQDGVGAEGLIPASHGVVQRDDNEEQDLFVRELFAREFFSDEPHGLFTRGQRTSNTRGQRTSNTRGGVRKGFAFKAFTPKVFKGKKNKVPKVSEVPFQPVTKKQLVATGFRAPSPAIRSSTHPVAKSSTRNKNTPFQPVTKKQLVATGFRAPSPDA